MQAPAIQSLLLLRSGFRFSGQRLFWGQAMLYRSHVRLVGWSTRGRYQRRIALADVEKVGWHTWVGEAPKLLLYLQDGEVVSLKVRGAALWRLTLEGLLKATKEARPAYRHQVLYMEAPQPGWQSLATYSGGDGMGVSSAASQTHRT